MTKTLQVCSEHFLSPEDCPQCRRTALQAGEAVSNLWEHQQVCGLALVRQDLHLLPHRQMGRFQALSECSAGLLRVLFRPGCWPMPYRPDVVCTRSLLQRGCQKGGVHRGLATMPGYTLTQCDRPNGNKTRWWCRACASPKCGQTTYARTLRHQPTGPHLRSIYPGLRW